LSRRRPAQLEEELQVDIFGYWEDPHGFVMYAFSWGKERMELANESGPDEWQKGELRAIGSMVRERAFDGINPVDPETSKQPRRLLCRYQPSRGSTRPPRAPHSDSTARIYAVAGISRPVRGDAPDKPRGIHLVFMLHSGQPFDEAGPHA
jgi:hypothetical protein